MSPTVLIIGAGPTGLVLAHELTRHGVACRIVDKTPHRSQHSKALAIHARTLESLELMGLAGDFLACGHPVAAGALHSGTRPLLTLGFDRLESRYPYILTLPQSETERLLEAALARRGIVVERNVELVGIEPRPPRIGPGEVPIGSGDLLAVLRHLDGSERIETTPADWIIGCDGAHSTVRHLLGIPFDGAAYDERFLLADVRIESPQGIVDPDRFQIFFAPPHPASQAAPQLLALFPFAAGRYRIIASQPPADWAAEPTFHQCQEWIDRFAPGAFRLSDPQWVSAFRIHHRSVSRLRHGSVFLVGDAAHIHSPAGGQGMNAGIQDAVNLAWKIALVASGRGRPEILDTYQAERLPIDRAIIRAADRLTRLATLRGTFLRGLRDRLLPLVGHLPALQDRLVATLSQISLRYPANPLVVDHGKLSAPARPGQRAPDAVLRHAQTGVPFRLFELFAGTQPTFLLLGENTASVSLVDLVRPFPITVAKIGAEWIDAEGQAARAYGVVPAAYLIRPDGIVGFRCPLDRAARPLRDYLSRLFGNAEA